MLLKAGGNEIGDDSRQPLMLRM